MDREVGKIFPPGHFYSPIPNIKEVRRREEKIFRVRTDNEVLGIDLNKEEQLKHLEIIGSYVDLFDYPETPEHNLKCIYYKNNGVFEKLDALAYFAFIIHYRPNRIVEIGSGFSSLIAMDVNKKFYNDKIEIALIEPYPSDYLRRGILFYRNAELIDQPVQDVDLSFFETLEENVISRNNFTPQSTTSRTQTPFQQAAS
ncbi:hypothetical protein [Archaeoglobus fulgidus]|uniref:hypothetical protein n=1 Tax=Archaeoglobus fulgidus TaxID=2234 RepID=UPI0011D0CE1A|nr:hypothetical protein [Archaeoglobus fulgidus]